MSAQYQELSIDASVWYTVTLTWDGVEVSQSVLNTCGREET